MPQFYLKVKADLENIESLTPQVGNLWKLDIQTPGGGDVRNGITISSDDVFPLDGSRGEANFIIKWPYTNDQAYIKILSNNKAIKPAYTAADSGKWVTILGLECRSIEPTAWHPSIDFNVQTTGGFVFEKVDLSEKEWADYDEENDLSVSIMGLEYKIENTP